MNPAYETQRICTFLFNQAKQADADGFVLGLSGGLDSTVTLYLADKAAQHHGNLTVRPVYMPVDVTSHEERKHAELAAEDIGIGLEIINLAQPFEEMQSRVGFPNSKIVQGNLQARLRMTTLYTIANKENLLVVGTGNMSEMATGYFTKYGDGACDVLPLGQLYKTEVRELAHHLGVPQAIIERTPTAGLWEGQTDEDELGVTYEQLDTILHLIESMEDKDRFEARIEEMDNITHEDAQRIINRISDNGHKLKIPRKPAPPQRNPP